MSERNDKIGTVFERGREGKAWTVVSPELLKDWLENYDGSYSGTNHTKWNKHKIR